VGRKEILGLYLSRVLTKSIDVDLLARGTTGFTGADLENMVNQAALRAAIDGADSVTMKYLESARDKVLMGMPTLSLPQLYTPRQIPIHFCLIT
jgi:ATP-dependent metalloprotease